MSFLGSYSVRVTVSRLLFQELAKVRDRCVCPLFRPSSVVESQLILMPGVSSQPSESSGAGKTLAPKTVEAQLGRIFSASAFARSHRLKAFLAYIVRSHLNGDDARLKEYEIGVEVFEKPPDFDPRIDSTVRVRANKLRSELEAYYSSIGQNDEILITLPKGHYIPTIVLRPASSGVAPHPQRPNTQPAIKLSARVAKALAVALFAIVLRGDMAHLRLAPPVPPGRLLLRATSEANHPRRIPLSHAPVNLTVSLAGDKVFALDTFGRVLSIVRTADGSVGTLSLPSEGEELVASPDGNLYIASAVDGVMVVDIAKERLTRILLAGGPVRDIAIDPKGGDLFLAMEQLGLKRLSPESGALTQITKHTCPIHVAIDHRGERLYVAYQCWGPSGRSGHDSVEIFDARTDKSLAIVSGPPMVGGHTSISLDDELAILDGGDACSMPGYDHAGCSAAPAHVFHLLRGPDRRILHTFVYPPEDDPGYSEGGYFIDNSRFLMFGDSLSVVDAATYTLLEKLELGQKTASAVLARDGSRLWAGVLDPSGIVEFNLEPDSCTALEPRPALLFPADGAFGSAQGATVLISHGNVAFTPGRVGQAFFLDGQSYLSADSTGYFRIYRHNFSVALYVKFSSISGDVALADWGATEHERGIRLLKSGDNHFVFQAWPGGAPITSPTIVAPNVWYHVAVTKTDDSLTLYVNGKAEASGKPPAHFAKYDGPLFLGAYEPGRPSLHGSLDEIAFYNRGLTAAEVGNLYRQRTVGACRSD